MITKSEAQRIAADWHGGQTSALYVFASSGTLQKKQALREIDQTIYCQPCESNVSELNQLKEYVLTSRAS